jgi:biotin operon repressor
MSMRLTADAMEVRVGNPLRKLVLLKLCDNANDRGQCWPSMQYVADQCEISTRSVMNHIATLEKDGFLRVIQRATKGKKISNLYMITLGEGIARQRASAKAIEQYELPVSGENLGGSSESPAHLSSELDSLLNQVSSESGSSSSESPAYLSSESPAHKSVIQPVIEPDINIFNSISLAALPKQISPAAAREFIDHRKRIEKPVTQGAFDREMGLALEAIKFGLAPDAVIRECIDAGWWNIKVEWARARMAKVNSVQPLAVTSKNISIADQLSDRSWAGKNNNQTGSHRHD